MPKKRQHLDTSPPPTSEKHLLLDASKENDFIVLARDRFQGALLDAVDPSADDTDDSLEPISTPKHERIYNADGKLISTPVKRDLNNDFLGDEDSLSDRPERRSSNKKRSVSPHHSTSYVMKLFDRSVDLAQFKEDTPLYPICRAWMANQPKNNFRPKSMHKTVNEDTRITTVELPPPEGSPVSRVPALLPCQIQNQQSAINFDYSKSPPIFMDILLRNNKQRWTSVRKQWYDQSVLYEARYAKTQQALDKMDTNNA